MVSMGITQPLDNLWHWFQQPDSWYHHSITLLAVLEKIKTHLANGCAIYEKQDFCVSFQFLH